MILKSVVSVFGSGGFEKNPAEMANRQLYLFWFGDSKEWLGPGMDL